MSYFTLTQAAAKAQVSTDTISRRIKDGTLPATKSGHKIVIPLDGLRKLYPDRFPEVHSGRTPGKCRVISFSNQKGGVGKTTTCANLAAALAELGYRVLAFDLDPQGNLTKALGVNPHDIKERNTYEILVKGSAAEAALLTPIPALPTLRLIATNLRLAAAEMQLMGEVARESRLARSLEPLLPEFDFVLIDTPPNLGIFTINALVAANAVMIPVTVDVYALDGVEALLNTIGQVRMVNPHLLNVWALANETDQSNLGKDIRAELQHAFKGNLLRSTIRRNQKIRDAQASKTPIVLWRADDMSTHEYRVLAEEVANERA